MVSFFHGKFFFAQDFAQDFLSQIFWSECNSNMFWNSEAFSFQMILQNKMSWKNHTLGIFSKVIKNLKIIISDFLWLYHIFTTPQHVGANAKKIYLIFKDFVLTEGP